MTRNRLGLLVLGSVTLAAIAGAFSGRAYFRHAQPAPPPAPEQPALTVDPAHLDFGDVWETDKFEWKVPVTNTGSQVLVVDRWQAGCDCSAITPQSLRVGPGETKSITVQIDLSSKVDSTSLTPVPISITFAAVVGGKGLPALTLRGKAKPIISVGTTNLSQTIPADARGATSRLNIELALPPDDITGMVEMFPVRCEVGSQSGRHVSFALKYSEAIPSGYHKFALVIRGKLASGQAFSKSFSCGVAVLPDIQPTPSELVVTGLVKGVREETITFRSLSDAPLVLVGAFVKGTAGSGTVVAQVESQALLSLTIRPSKDVPEIQRETVTAVHLAGWHLRLTPIELTITP